jgi:NAD+--asparagine ADP-ribosyltransferase
MKIHSDKRKLGMVSKKIVSQEMASNTNIESHIGIKVP